jgi:hypothetical protein
MKNQLKNIYFVGILGVALLTGAAHAQTSDSFTGIPAYGPNAVYEGLDAGSVWRDAQIAAIERAINPDDYICSSPTSFDLWIGQLFGSIDPLSLDILDALSAFYWAGDQKAVFDNDASDEYIGVDGEYTREQIKRHKDNKRFWDAPIDDVLLLGMHGAAVGDDDVMRPFISWAFGAPDFITDYIVDTAQTTIEGGYVNVGPLLNPPQASVIVPVPGIPRGYNNPVLTLNAFAFTTGGGAIPGAGVPPDKIVMGEGLLDGLAAIGLGDVGPDYVHAHEVAHHVQFEIGAFLPGPPTPEATRRTELMADGFAAYYSSHARGATFQAKRFADVMASAFGVGDCAFSNPNHHGTHLQREASAVWGESIFDGQKKKGHIKSAYEMLWLFDAALPGLVAPDAP